MLKLLMAQFGVHVDQATVDDMIKNVTSCIDDVKAMRESQMRTEMMVRALYLKAGYSLEVPVASSAASANAPHSMIGPFKS